MSSEEREGLEAKPEAWTALFGAGAPAVGPMPRAGPSVQVGRWKGPRPDSSRHPFWEVQRRQESRQEVATGNVPVAALDCFRAAIEFLAGPRRRRANRRKKAEHGMVTPTPLNDMNLDVQPSVPLPALTR